MWRAAAGYVVLFVLTASACSTSHGGAVEDAVSADHAAPTVTAIVGPTGGTLALGAAVALVVPAGALSEPITLTITLDATARPPAGVRALTPIYRFGPEGTTFAEAVQVTFTSVPAVADAVAYWSLPGSDAFGPVDATRTADGHTFVANVMHFSGGFVGAGWDPARCSNEQGPWRALLDASRPVAAAGVGPMIISLASGPGSTLYAIDREQRVWVAADGHHFEAFSDAEAPAYARGDQGVVDPSNDWVYRVHWNGSDSVIRRRHSQGCFEDVQTWAGRRVQLAPGGGPAGEVFGLSTNPSGPVTRVLFGHADGAFSEVGEGLGIGLAMFASAPSDALRQYVVLAGDSRAEVRVSRDGGSSWTQGMRPVPGISGSSNSLIVDPLQPASLAVVAAGKLVGSSDSGTTWAVDPHPPPPGEVLRLQFDGRGALYASRSTSTSATLARRAAGSSSWSVIDGSMPPLEFAGLGTFHVDPDAPHRIWRAARSLWVSGDAGRTWSTPFYGLPGQYADPLTTDPNDERRFLIATQWVNGALLWYVTNDGGATFEEVGPFLDLGYPRLAILRSGTMMAFGASLVSDPDLGARRSTDHGVTWQRVSGLGHSVAVVLLAEEGRPNEPLQVDAPGGAAYLSLDNVLYRSTDDGAHWAQVGPKKAQSGWFLADPVVARHVVFVPESDSESYEESADGGDHWTTSGMPAVSDGRVRHALFDSTGTLWFLVVDATGAAHLLARRRGATAFVEVPASVSASDWLRELSGKLYLTHREGLGRRDVIRQVFSSSDGGSTWTEEELGIATPVTADANPFSHRANPKRVLFFLPALRTLLLP